VDGGKEVGDGTNEKREPVELKGRPILLRNQYEIAKDIQRVR